MNVRYYYHRYRFMSVLFILLLIFGLKVYPPSAPQIDKSIFQLNDEQHRYTLFDHIPTIANKNYRITFAAKLAPKDVLRAQKDLRELPKISTYRSAELVSTLKLSTSILRNVGDWQYFSIEFKGSGYEENFFVEKEKSAGSLIIALRPLTITSLGDAAQYNPTIFGAGVSKISSSIGADKESLSYRRVSASRGLLLQPLPNNLNNIASIELLVSSTGFGGSGRYKLAIYEIETNNGNIAIGRETLTLAFTPAEALAYSLGDDWYKFPISVVLEAGKRYGLVIDSSEVRTSPFHYLSFGTVPAEESTNHLYKVKSLEKSVKPLTSALAMKLFTRDTTALGNQSLLEGQILEDRGDSLLMTYEMQREPAHLLDISNIDVGTNITGPYYSEKSRRVEMKVVSSASYQYKLPLGGQLTKAEIAYETTSPASSDIHVSYSLDGENWHSLDPEQWAVRSLIINQVSGPGTTIWIRVSYVPTTESEAIFGLNYLKVIAETKND